MAAATTATLGRDLVHKMDAYWRAANYLLVGQIYLLSNPLLRKPLKLEHIKPRLLGHWGTTPGLNFIYVHLNRVIKDRLLRRVTPHEIKLLSALVKNAGKVMTHRQLLREVWGPSLSGETHYLRVYMNQLRQKLESDPARAVYLLTEPGVGYRLAPDA
jgi:hypothetical protein